MDDRLRALGITLPTPSIPAANYVPCVIVGDMAYVAGQVPFWDGALTHTGIVGRDLDLDAARAAARVCGLNVLAHLFRALDNDLGRVVRCVRLGGFVACTPEFTDHPKVVNGASDLMVDVFGDAGRHARAAVGCASLPLGAAVEVEALFQIRPAGR